MPVPTAAEIDVTIKKIDAALEGIQKAKGGYVKLRKAELELNSHIEKLRDDMYESLEASTGTDRSAVNDVFGGDCIRIARIRDCLESARFSADMGGDDLKATALEKCQSVEDVLNDLGAWYALREAKEKVAGMTARREEERIQETMEQANATLTELGVDIVASTLEIEIAPHEEEHTLPAEPEPLPPKVAATNKVRVQPIIRQTVTPIIQQTVSIKQRILYLMRSGRLREICIAVFQKVDVECKYEIVWNTRQIPIFVKSVFHNLGIPIPTEMQIYSMYTRFDADGSWSLDTEEGCSLIEMMCCELYEIERSEDREKVVASVEGGEVAALVDATFTRHAGESSDLDWNTDAIRNFFVDAFGQMKLPAPTEEQMFAMTKQFDVDGDMCLNIYEARSLVETLSRSLYNIKQGFEATSCEKGHVMKLAVIMEGQIFQCNVCSEKLDKGNVMYGCRVCDFDMCVSCAKSRRRHMSSVGGPLAKS